MKTKKKLVVLSFAVILLFSITITSFAALEHWNDNSSNKKISLNWENWKAAWESVKNNYEYISLTPGATENNLNFAWYSQKPNQAIVRISNMKDMNKAIIYSGTSQKYKQLKGVTYYSNKVTVTNLNSKTLYFYQYYLDGKWTKTMKYKTQNTKEFSFLYVGDAQIGASVGQIASGSKKAQSAEHAARNDAYSWNTTLETALDANPDLSFIVSAGDQINEKVKDKSQKEDQEQEIEYSGFLSSNVLTSLPIATVIGNHDSNTANYKNHFNNPISFTEETTPTTAGNGYYFTYGNVLFIMLNTNNYNFADHEALLKKATNANPDIKWKIVTMHHDIYGSGAGHSASDGIKLRKQLTKLMDKYDIDVVLQGHDHTYSRSYQLMSDKTEKSGYKIVSVQKDAANNIVTNPKGVLYMEANSPTGSKFYNLIPIKQNYIASRSQTWAPCYSVISVTKDSLTISTYNVSTGKKIDVPYTIKK